MFFKIISFDIEVIPLNINQMPTPETCPIVLISNHFNYDYNIVHLGKNYKIRNIVLILTKDYESIEIKENRIVYFYTSEVKLLNHEFELLKNNDILTGYNITGFDIVYLIDRARILGIKRINIGNGNSNFYYSTHLAKGFKITKIGGLVGKILIDVLAVLRREDATNVFLKKYNLKKLTLEHVSKEILKIEKLEFSIDEMVKYWGNTNDVEHRNKFIDYCSRDSELALMFLTKFRLLDKFIALSKASGKITQEIIDSQGSGAMVENLLLKEFRKYDRVLPIRLKSTSLGEELEGAYVLDPKLGISNDIVSGDYSSLYPSLIIRHNLCYSTVILQDPKELGLTEDDYVVQCNELGIPYARFVKREKYIGIVPKKLTELLALRASQKKELKKYEKDTPNYFMLDSSQNATKILLNSFYGYSGDSSAKVYSWFIASAVTTNGRVQIKKTINIINNTIIQKNGITYLMNVIAADTDSSYIQVRKQDNSIISKDEVISVANDVLDKVNLTLEKPMKMAYENYIKRIIIVAKKRYAMLTVDDNGKENIVSKGIETVRRDWSNYSTENMSKVVDFLLKEKDIQVGINKSVDLIKDQVKLLNEGKVNLNDLVLSNKLTKAITSYDNDEAHVKVAIKMKERGRPSEIGDRIQFIVLDNGMKLISDKSEEADYVIKNQDKCKIDKHYYIHDQLIPPTLRMLELLGVKKELLLVKMDEKQSTFVF